MRSPARPIWRRCYPRTDVRLRADGRLGGRGVRGLRAGGLARRTDGRTVADPAASRRSRGAWRPPPPRSSSPAPTSTPAAAGTPPWRWPSVSDSLGVRDPAPGGGRLGFRRAIRTSAECCRRRSAPSPRPSAHTTWCWSRERRCSPTTSYISGALLPEARTGGDHLGPRRGGEGTDGRGDRGGRRPHARAPRGGRRTGIATRASRCLDRSAAPSRIRSRAPRR